MRLGTETGSLMNHLYSRQSAVPKVGMGATLLSWSDRSPATVVEVFKQGKYVYVGVQGDNYKRTDKNGLSECQEYEYTRNTDAHVRYFRQKDGGKFEACYKSKETGRWKKTDGGVTFGVRERFYDFSF